MPWVRPEGVPVGQVWSRFKGRPQNGKPAKYFQVRDMSEDWRKRCLDMMQETFLRDEPLCIALGINEDPASLTTIRANWERFVSQHMSLACFTEVNGEPEELVGFNIVVVNTLNDEEEDFDKIKGESWKKLLRTLIMTEELVDVFSHYGVNTYLTCSGLTVLPEYRGNNIAVEILAARKPLCAAMGISTTASVFTAKPAQIQAKKCGYELLGELDYSKMMEYGVDLSSCSSSSAKLMGIKF